MGVSAPGTEKDSHPLVSQIHPAVLQAAAVEGVAELSAAKGIKVAEKDDPGSGKLLVFPAGGERSISMWL